jgi:hypothetical protein
MVLGEKTRVVTVFIASAVPNNPGGWLDQPAREAVADAMNTVTTAAFILAANR